MNYIGEFWVKLRDPASVNKVKIGQDRLLILTLGFHMHSHMHAHTHVNMDTHTEAHTTHIHM